MTADRNPQAEQMGDESMARNLAHQAEAIWPQERPLFDRYGLSGAFEILDVGCGTGEITRRLADRYPQARLLGLDILDGNLQLARRDSAAYGDRVRYEVGDAFALRQADASVANSEASTTGPVRSSGRMVERNASTCSRSRRGMACSSFTKARKAGSSMPPTAPAVAVRSAIDTARASSSSNSNGGNACPARNA